MIWTWAVPRSWWSARSRCGGRNTSVSFGEHFADLVDTQVWSSRCGSASDVLRAGLRPLESRETQVRALGKRRRSMRRRALRRHSIARRFSRACVPRMAARMAVTVRPLAESDFQWLWALNAHSSPGQIDGAITTTWTQLQHGGLAYREGRPTFIGAGRDSPCSCVRWRPRGT